MAKFNLIEPGIFKGYAEVSDTETLTKGNAYLFTFHIIECTYELPPNSKQHIFYVTTGFSYIRASRVYKVSIRITAEEIKNIKLKNAIGMTATFTLMGYIL